MPSGPGALLSEVAERGEVGSLMSAIRDAVRDWVGAGPMFLATADPVTNSFTGTFAFDIPDDAASAFFAIELGRRDVVSFEALTKSPAPMATLFAATDDRPESSERWREVISPLGWGDELRAVVRGHGSTWGYLCVHREASERSFAPRDLARLNALLPAIAAAMRKSALTSPVHRAAMDPGVVLVDHRGRMTGTTGGADAWLDELGPCQRDGLPLLLAGLTRMVFDTGRPVSSSLTGRTGRVAIVDAALLQHVGSPQVAIVISSAAPGHRLERLAAAGELSAREREVVACVLDGLSSRAIADRLGISPHTVQAHLTSVFAKTNVRSRRELLSMLSR